MININLSRDYFISQAKSIRSEDVMDAYLKFIEEHIFKPLGAKDITDSENVKVTIKQERAEVLSYRNQELGIYDLYDLVHDDTYVVSLQRKSLKGAAAILALADKMKKHPAVVSIDERHIHFTF